MFIRRDTMNISDILVHVRTDLDPDDRNTVEQELREVDGIISPHFTDNNNHMLMVAYDPAKVNTGGLMEKVSSMGLDASLVGM